jgi:glycosyltransferase involved in cell wall biosynthesis
MIVASEFMKSVLFYNGFDEARISVIPIFTDIPILDSRTILPKESLILSVGRMFPGKGMDYLLRAFALIKQDARLTIAGDGPQMADLKTKSQELGISPRVTFTGWLSHSELDKLYRSCTIVVVPSVWPESFGMVGIEAMAYAKPVIAFDVGGISEWLTDGETGFLVNPKDIVGLAEKIETILHDPGLAERMGAKALDTVKKRFLAESHINQLLTLFEKTIDSFQKK